MSFLEHKGDPRACKLCTITDAGDSDCSNSCKGKAEKRVALLEGELAALRTELKELKDAFETCPCDICVHQQIGSREEPCISCVMANGDDNKFVLRELNQESEIKENLSINCTCTPFAIGDDMNCPIHGIPLDEEE